MIGKIKCPSCGDSFDVEEALSGELKAHLDSEVKKRLETEKKNIERSAVQSVEEKMKALEEENNKTKMENRKFKEKEVALRQQESDLKEKEEELKISTQRELLKGKEEIEEKARKKEGEKFKLREIELRKQIEDSKKLAEELQRKAEQGSMQIQGKAQELVLKEFLSNTYPFDRIDDVPTGTKGADVIQTVVNKYQKECGCIFYESKRTKSFSNGWIDKLKKDQIEWKADIGVIVTKTLPKDIDRFGQMNGVWICGFEEIESLSFILREMIIKVHSVKLSQENKGGKMEFLYNYLTGSEFVQNIKQIIETYDSMNQQLNSEKKAMQKIWSEREKQIWVVQESISNLFGSIKGIVGNELETANILELPGNTSGE